MNPIEAVLNYWFEGLDDSKLIDKKSSVVRKWFNGTPRIDEEIRTRFEDDLIKAKEGKYKNWEKPIRGRLALVLLFDQFSRNIYRHTPEMYAADPLALDLTRRTTNEGLDEKLQLIERLFLYIPLMHSEDLENQKKSILYFEGLIKLSQEKCPRNTAYFKDTLQYAQEHYKTIERFGRFPHRDAVLKRISQRIF